MYFRQPINFDRGPTYYVTNNYETHCHGRHGGGWGSMGGWANGMMITGGIFGIANIIMNLVGTFRGGYSNPYAYLNQQYSQNYAPGNAGAPTSTTNTMKQGLEQLQKTFNEDNYTFSIVGDKYVAEKEGAPTLSGTLDEIRQQLINERNKKLSSTPEKTPKEQVTDALDDEVAKEDGTITKNDDGTYTLKDSDIKFKVNDDGTLSVISPADKYPGKFNNLETIKDAITKAQSTPVEETPDDETPDAETPVEETPSADTEYATVIVRNGESFQKLAQKYGVTVEQLKDANADLIRSYTDCNGKKHEFFLVGAQIKVPRNDENAKAISENEFTDETKAGEVNKYRTAVRNDEHLATIECEDQARGEGVLTEWENYTSTQTTQGTEISNQQVTLELKKAGLLSNNNIKVDLDKKEITYKDAQGKDIKVPLNKENLETAINTVKNAPKDATAKTDNGATTGKSSSDILRAPIDENHPHAKLYKYDE